MYDFEKPCPHTPTQPHHSKVLPNHHPLTRAQVIELLGLLKSNGRDIRLVGKVLGRMDQAIPGMTCPVPRDGEVAYKSLRLSRLLLDGPYSYKDATTEMVDDVMALIK